MPKSVDNKFYGPSMEGQIDGQPLYATSTTKKHDLGYRWALPDGRVFRYAKNGAVALAAGKLVQAKATQHVSATVGLTNRALLAGTTAAIGATTIKVSIATTMTTTNLPPSVANGFAGGLLTVGLGTGLGHSYRIGTSLTSAQALYGAGVTNFLTLGLDDPIRVALTTTSSVLTVTKNPYDDVVVARPAAVTGMPLGVTPIVVAASTATVPVYFWLQTWGACACYQGGVPTTAAAIGNQLIPALTTTQIALSTTNCAGGGAFFTRPLSTTTPASIKTSSIGWAMMATTTTSGSYIPVFLQIAP